MTPFNKACVSPFYNFIITVYLVGCMVMVEHKSLTDKIFLSCTRLAAEAPLKWVNHSISVSQPGHLSLSSFLG